MLLGDTIQHYTWIHRPQWNSFHEINRKCKMSEFFMCSANTLDNRDHAPENNMVPTLTYPGLCSKVSKSERSFLIIVLKAAVHLTLSTLCLYRYLLLFYSTHFHLLDYTLICLFLPSLAYKVQDRSDFVLYISVLSKLAHCLVLSKY